jgi:hypothetical protein
LIALIIDIHRSAAAGSLSPKSAPWTRFIKDQFASNASKNGAVKLRPQILLVAALVQGDVDWMHFLFTMSKITTQTDASAEIALDDNQASPAGSRPNIASRLVEPDGIEPTTSCLQSMRSPN